MGVRDKEVGAFEAKTRLAELLRETEQGRSFVIRRRGKAVARLVPPEAEDPTTELAQVVADLRSLRESQEGTLDVCELIQRGRQS